MDEGDFEGLQEGLDKVQGVINAYPKETRKMLIDWNSPEMKHMKDACVLAEAILVGLASANPTSDVETVTALMTPYFKGLFETMYVMGYMKED